MFVKDVERVLRFTELILRFGYHNVVQRYELKDVKKELNDTWNVYAEVYKGLSDPTSTTQLYLTSTNRAGFITFIMYDTVAEDVLHVFSTNDLVVHTSLYDDWAIIKPNSTQIQVFTNDEKNPYATIELNMEEDEHFQKMMLHDMPEFEHIQEVALYLNEMIPILRQYKRVAIVNYERLHADLSRFEPNDKFIEDCEIEFSGSKLYYEEGIKSEEFTRNIF